MTENDVSDTEAESDHGTTQLAVSLNGLAGYAEDCGNLNQATEFGSFCLLLSC